MAIRANSVKLKLQAKERQIIWFGIRMHKLYKDKDIAGLTAGHKSPADPQAIMVVVACATLWRDMEIDRGEPVQPTSPSTLSCKPHIHFQCAPARLCEQQTSRPATPRRDR